MRDVSKCSNTECPLRGVCMRYLVKPLYMQVYSVFNHTENGCGDFVQILDRSHCNTLAEMDKFNGKINLTSEEK